MSRLLAVATFGCLALLLPGASLERLSLSDMISKSTGIVRGKVVSTYTAASGPMVYTHYRVQVSEKWKGANGGVVDVVVPGGSTPSLRQSFSGAPSLASGKDYVLFLWHSRSGLTHIIGLTQGIFTLQAGTNGGLTAVRPAATEPMVDAYGKPATPEALSIPLDTLRTQVQKALSVGENQ